MTQNKFRQLYKLCQLSNNLDPNLDYIAVQSLYSYVE